MRQVNNPGSVRSVRALAPLARRSLALPPVPVTPKRAPRRDFRDGNEAGEPVLLLTVPQVCQRLQCGKRGLYQLMNAGDLASVKIGGARRIPVSAVDDFLEAIRAASRQPRRVCAGGQDARVRPSYGA